MYVYMGCMEDVWVFCRHLGKELIMATYLCTYSVDY
jgi:hypothetical protein